MDELSAVNVRIKRGIIEKPRSFPGIHIVCEMGLFPTAVN